MKKFYLPMLLICTLSLLGCTVESKRIYTVCKVDENGVQYCYDLDGNFYYRPDDKLVKISGVGLHSYPALILAPRSGDYYFEYQLPGKYKGTLRSVNCYVYKLLKDPNAELIYKSRDCYTIDCFITSDVGSTRILFNKSGNVRIYFINNSAIPSKPLYISEE